MNFQICMLFTVAFAMVNGVTEEDEGVKYANKCEGNQPKDLMA